MTAVDGEEATSGMLSLLSPSSQWRAGRILPAPSAPPHGICKLYRRSCRRHLQTAPKTIWQRPHITASNNFQDQDTRP